MNFLKKRSLKKDIKHLKKSIRSRLKHDDDILNETLKDKLKLLLEKTAKISLNSYSDSLKEYNEYTQEYVKIIPRKNFKIIRDYAEIIVVALTVAFGIRALYIQPFKIPTGSMQPTLFGIHYMDKSTISEKIPQPLNYLLFSTLRAEATISEPGTFNGLYPPYNKYLIFPWTSFDIGGVKYSLPGSAENVAEYCFMKFGQIPNFFNVGETLCNGWLSDGDHLFVNRLIYHFIEPQRGDIVVFETVGLKEDSNGSPLTKVGFYYVKRLVGMPGDTLKIVNGTLMVKPAGKNIFSPIKDFGYPFERMYSDLGGYQPYTAVGRLAIGKEVIVPKNDYFMLGDNTQWSEDSRYWGFVPRKNIVGRASFVFWPFSRRWGIADSKKPLDVPTTVSSTGYIKEMNLQ